MGRPPSNARRTCHDRERLFASSVRIYVGSRVTCKDSSPASAIIASCMHFSLLAQDKEHHRCRLAMYCPMSTRPPGPLRSDKACFYGPISSQGSAPGEADPHTHPPPPLLTDNMSVAVATALPRSPSLSRPLPLSRFSEGGRARERERERE